MLLLVGKKNSAAVREHKMRLVEFTPPFVRSQLGTLLTILQHLRATVGQGIEGSKSAKVPMASLINLMQHTGNSFSYGDFKQLYDTEPRVQALVSNFNQNEILCSESTAIDFTGFYYFYEKINDENHFCVRIE
jgi:hypothetical protein